MISRIITGLLCIGAVAVGAPFTSLHFFGDSLTDTGNVLKASSTLNRYSFGLIPKHPTAPYEQGRFTNGPVWAEHVAARLDRPEDAAAAGMSMGWFGQIGGAGSNYAVGGARTDNGGALGLLDYMLPTGMATQVDFYLNRTGGTADASGLYFLVGSGNDLRDAARLADPAARLQAAHTAGANIAYSVRDLYLAGARNFVLINSPDIGLIPESIGDGLTEAGTEVSLHFNSWFGLYADYLRYSVPEFSLYYFDLFGLHHELVAQHGMQAVRPCKSEPYACGETLFFDSIHPSAWVHELIGNRLANDIRGQSLVSATVEMRSFAADSVHTPEPSTSVLILSAVTVIGFIRFRAAQ